MIGRRYSATGLLKLLAYRESIYDRNRYHAFPTALFGKQKQPIDYDNSNAN
jgi:hypothetical protein